MSTGKRVSNPIQMKVFARRDKDSSEEWELFCKLCDKLHVLLGSEAIYGKIKEAHVHGASSKDVQDKFIKELCSKKSNFNFSSEKKGLFSNYPTANLRPDYFCKITEDIGVLLEVERGKTIHNNMDIYDFWKCHICTEASFLILIVPMQIKHKHRNTPLKAFEKVCERLEPFFQDPNYTNVWGLTVFGY